MDETPESKHADNVQRRRQVAPQAIRDLSEEGDFNMDIDQNKIIYPKRPKMVKRRRAMSSRRRGRRSSGMDRDTVELRRKALEDGAMWGIMKGQEARFNTEPFVRGTTANLYAFGASAAVANETQRANRNKYKYRGAGDYRGWVPRVAGAAIGGLRGFGQGGWAGGITGGVQGWQQGADYSRMQGWGDYGAVSSNKIISGGSGAGTISVNDDSLTGDISFAHTEYIGNLAVTTPSTGSVTGITQFNIQSFDLNPGVNQSFPFLSQIASNFELYQWEGLIFQYKPLSGEFGASSTSNTLGKIVAATKYGVEQNNAFSSMIEMQNYDYANSTKPSCGLVHGVETAPRQGLTEMLLMRTGAPANDTPRVLYDIGKLYLATEGIPFNGLSQTIVLGELWVTYKCKLSRAKLFDSLQSNQEFDRFSGATTNTNFTGAVTTRANNIGCSWSPGAFNGGIQFPANVTTGRYVVIIEITSVTAGAATAPGIAATTFSTIVSSFGAPVGAGATSARMILIAVVDVNAPNNNRGNVTITLGTMPSAGTYQLSICQVNPAYNF